MVTKKMVTPVLSYLLIQMHILLQTDMILLASKDISKQKQVA